VTSENKYQVSSVEYQVSSVEYQVFVSVRDGCTPFILRWLSKFEQIETFTTRLECVGISRNMSFFLRSVGSEAPEATKKLYEALASNGSKETLRSLWSLRMT
jgi:hypothetical protein